jgi:DnaJ-class molecular chaperone
MQTPFIPLVVEDEAMALTVTECPICGGDGFLVNDDEAEIQCESCDGTGYVQPEEPAC